MITVSVLIDKLKLNGYAKLLILRSLARASIRHLASKGLIKCVGDRHSKFGLYTTTAEKKAVVVDAKATGGKKEAASKKEAKK